MGALRARSQVCEELRIDFRLEVTMYRAEQE